MLVPKRLVQTDMGNTGARLFGMEEAPVPTKASVDDIVARECLLELQILTSEEEPC